MKHLPTALQATVKRAKRLKFEDESQRKVNYCIKELSRTSPSREDGDIRMLGEVLTAQVRAYDQSLQKETNHA